MSLPDDVRVRMESFFAADLSMVRIHIGHLAVAMGCHAFTFGNHIYFAPGQFNPSTIEGMQMLGHELTHVLQQQCGRAAATQEAQGVVLDDRLLEVEADLMGVFARRPQIRLQMHLEVHKQLLCSQRPPCGLGLSLAPINQPFTGLPPSSRKTTASLSSRLKPAMLRAVTMWAALWAYRPCGWI